MLRKFYEAAAEEAKASETNTEVINNTSTEEAKPTLAEAMAKSGTKVEGLSKVDNPLVNKEEAKEETKATETEAPAATAKEEEKVVKVETEAPKPEELSKVEEKPTTEASAKSEISWQKVLEQQQPKAVLKALGFNDELTDLVSEMKELDPKVLGLFQSYKDGTITEYLRELTTDYSKMSDEDVMRYQLQKEYPKATQKQLETLFKKEVVERYNLDSDDEEELEEGQNLLAVKADRHRDEFIENQEKYLLPKYVERTQNENQVDPQIQAQQQEIERVTKIIEEDSYIRNLVDKNVYSFGEGEDVFNFPIEGLSIKNLVINGDETGELMFDKVIGENGNESYIPKSKHQALVAIVNKYGESFLNELVKHGKSLGAKKVIEQIENAKPIESVNTSQSQSKPQTMAEAMAKGGRMVNG